MDIGGTSIEISIFTVVAILNAISERLKNSRYSFYVSGSAIHVNDGETDAKLSEQEVRQWLHEGVGRL